jgi:hypothetical protein
MDLSVFSAAAIIASITIPGTALLITVVKTRGSTKDNQADNKTLRGMENSVCSLHSGVAEKLNVICEQQEEMRKDIKELLKRPAGHMVGI